MMWRALAPSLLAVCVAGCSALGDFGRPRYVDSGKLAEKEPLVTAGIPSQYPITDDERQLRELARNILDVSLLPEKARERERSLPPDAVVARVSPEAYADYMVNGPFRSATARYSRLIDAARDDITRLDQFFIVGRRVADLDRKREQSLPHVARLSADELQNARRRIRENMMLMAEVHGVVADRLAMYRFALERLVIALPSPMAVEVERTQGALAERLVAVQVIGRPVAEPQAVVSK